MKQETTPEEVEHQHRACSVCLCVQDANCACKCHKARVREVLEGCCKLVCKACAEGNEATSIAGMEGWVHIVKGFMQPFKCEASAIRTKFEKELRS
jgi:hypothetical protein